jgi:hypothetical protein
MPEQSVTPLWQSHSHIWKSESAFLSWIRGGIRRSLWNRHPIKLEFIKKNRERIPNPNPRGKVPTVWGGRCSLTGEILPLNKLEVDHKVGEHSLRSVKDIQSFIEGVVFVTEDMLQFVSREAHKVKSYAEKQGISFEKALAIKQAIAWEKKPVKDVVAFLAEHGYNGKMTKAQRRASLEVIFLKEK